MILGLDLSTQQLKCVAIDPETLISQHEYTVDFHRDLSSWEHDKGVIVNGDQVYTDVRLWIAALDLLLHRMKTDRFEFGQVVAIGGACQQHGSVYWSRKGDAMLRALDARCDLGPQITADAFATVQSPNWQDSRTGVECKELEKLVGGAESLAQLTGSCAHQVSIIELHKVVLLIL